MNQVHFKTEKNNSFSASSILSGRGVKAVKGWHYQIDNN